MDLINGLNLDFVLTSMDSCFNCIQNPVLSYTVGGALCVVCCASAVSWWLVVLQEWFIICQWLSACDCVKLNCFIKNLLYLSDTLPSFSICINSMSFSNSIINSLSSKELFCLWSVSVCVRGWMRHKKISWHCCPCFYFIGALWKTYLSPGRLRTKQTLSTASSKSSSQVDSRGRTRSKMASQSQRKYLHTCIHAHVLQYKLCSHSFCGNRKYNQYNWQHWSRSTSCFSFI